MINHRKFLNQGEKNFKMVLICCLILVQPDLLDPAPDLLKDELEIGALWTLLRIFIIFQATRVSE